MQFTLRHGASTLAVDEIYFSLFPKCFVCLHRWTIDTDSQQLSILKKIIINASNQPKLKPKITDITPQTICFYLLQVIDGCTKPIYRNKPSKINIHCHSTSLHPP